MCQGRLPSSLVQELTSQLADLSSNLIHDSKQAQKRMTLLGTLIFTVFNRNQAKTQYGQSHNDWGNGEYQHLKRSTRQKQHRCLENGLRAASHAK